jgi:hypothetical protein
MIVQADERIGEFEIIFPSGARMILQGEPSASWLREGHLEKPCYAKRKNIADAPANPGKDALSVVVICSNV